MGKVKFKLESVYKYIDEVEIDEDDADRFESDPSSFDVFYSNNGDPVLLDWKVTRK